MSIRERKAPLKKRIILASIDSGKLSTSAVATTQNQGSLKSINIPSNKNVFKLNMLLPEIQRETARRMNS